MTKFIEHDCSRYHPVYGERALSAGDPDPGPDWLDNPTAAGLLWESDGRNGTRFVPGPGALESAPAPEAEPEPEPPVSEVPAPAAEPSEPDPLDRDANGKKGGSLPKAKRPYTRKPKR
jgi:hypothetical protein